MSSHATESSIRPIGATGIHIFPLGLGGNVFGGRLDDDASRRILDAFVERGGNFIDTADSYSSWLPGNRGGESETILGDWMQRRANRDAVVIATKVSQHPEFEGLAPDNVQRALDASLARLRTDYVDLYYAHYDEPERPIEEIAATFDATMRAGKVRHVAISNFSADRANAWIEHAHLNGLAVPVALQPEYNLVRRADYEREIEPLAIRHGVAVFPYFGLAAGFLSGKYRTMADLEGAFRRRSVEKHINEDGLRVIDTLVSVAEAHGAAPATVSLAWLLAKPTVTAPLASATSEQQLDELMAAPALLLGADDVSRLDEASSVFARD